MSVIMMSAPSFANARACDLPWPRAPPVISTTLPSNRPTAPLLLIDGPAWRSPGSRDAVACAFVSTGRHLVSVPRSGGPPLDLLGDRRHAQCPGPRVLLLPPDTEHDGRKGPDIEGVYRFFRGLGVDRHHAPTAALEIGSQLLQLRSQTQTTPTPVRPEVDHHPAGGGGEVVRQPRRVQFTDDCHTATCT